MRFLGLTLYLVLGASVYAHGPSQQPSPPAPQAILLQAVAAMGASVPSDSTANGTITTVAGSLTESGSIVILTRGTDQTSEQIQTPHRSTLVYSRGQAALTVTGVLQSLPLELAVSSQSPDFPLPLLAGALNNPDTTYVYIGLETLNSVVVQHVQFWNSFASSPDLQVLASFSRMDLWTDANSGLPQRVSYSLTAAQGAPSIPVDVFFSNYTSAGGLLYPFSIQKSLNGTPWETITIQNVALNTGLTDANFPVQ